MTPKHCTSLAINLANLLKKGKKDKKTISIDISDAKDIAKICQTMGRLIKLRDLQEDLEIEDRGGDSRDEGKAEVWSLLNQELLSLDAQVK